MIFSLKRFLLLFLLLIQVSQVWSQNTFHFKNNRKREQLAFTKARGLVIVKTYINGKGPFNFILDTGVGVTVITDPTLKDSLKLGFTRSINITGLGEGADIEAFTTPFLKIEIGSTIAESASAAILSKDIFNLSGYAGMPIHGLLGYDFFSSFMVRVFYDIGLLNIYDNNLPVKFISKGYRIPISIEGNKPYINVIAAQGKIKMPMKMIIDTGAGHPISLEAYEKLGFPLPEKFMIANLGVGLSGNINGFMGRIDQLKIGKYNIDNPITAFPYYEDVAAKTLSVPRNGSIGNQILKRFEILFDYEHQYIYLKPNTMTTQPFEHDMSGMELMSFGEDFNRYIISRIEPHSPADDLGLRKDDELLNVNFKPVSKMTFEEVTEILKSKDGRNIYMEIGRGDELMRVVLTLKRRI